MKLPFLPRIRNRVVLVVALCLLMTSSFFAVPPQPERLDRYNNFVANAVDHWVEDHTPELAHRLFTNLAEIIINPFSYLKEQFDTEHRHSHSGQWVNKALSFLEDGWEFLQMLRMELYIVVVGGTFLLIWTASRREFRRTHAQRLKVVHPRRVYRFADDRRDGF
jgi:hypothetical protein